MTETERGNIFENLTSEQRIKVMNETGPKGANQLYNSVDVKVRREFLDSLGGKENITKFTDIIRGEAVKDYWANERELIRQGKGTYNWTPEQQQAILNGKTPYTDFANADGELMAFEGHHMKNVADYPEYAGDYRNIQPLYGNANTEGTAHCAAHGGSSSNPTQGYYDDYIQKMTDFTSKGLDDGYPPKIELTDPCKEVRAMDSFKNAEHTNFSEKIPFYDSLGGD